MALNSSCYNKMAPKQEHMALEGRGKPNEQPEIILARWSTRFWAWLLDFIIVTVAFEILFAIAYAPLAFMQGINGNIAPPWLGGVRYAIQSLMFFAYWTYFESTSGQSIGKKLLKIKTTDMAGNLADVKSVAIQSFGKSFLLPLDVLLGWIFTNDKRQRLLSRAANTIVIKTAEEKKKDEKDDGEGSSSNVQYRKD
jgi:uncharacterized RDD family membrane protein YckC